MTISKIKPLPKSDLAPDQQETVVDVRDILGDKREAILIHKGERYRLRITANDKLILTK